ncbi:MAG: RodZ domain-containing protein [Fibrobacterota bacterium]
MNKEKNTNDTSAAGDSGTTERVGDILKRERVKLRLSINHIADDLKFNKSYIEALEACDYDKLPAAPYVRVYLKTLAQYLSLDPKELIRKYSEETNQFFPDPKKERNDTISIRVSQDRKPNHWIPISVLILLIGAFIFVLNRTQPTPEEDEISPYGERPPQIHGEKPAVPENDHAGDAEEKTENAEESEPENAPGDEESESDPAEDSGEREEESRDDEQSDDQSEAAGEVDESPPLSLILEIREDSTWMQIYADGRRVKNGIYQTQSMDITARDSININMGNNSVVNYTLNSEPLNIPGTSVRITRITPDTVVEWSRSRWNETFVD